MKGQRVSYLTGGIVAPPHCVYFAQAGTAGLIKIGVSNNPSERIKALRYDAGEPVHLLGVIPGDYATEQAWHARFHSQREHGEWFRPTPELYAAIVAAIAEHPSPPAPKPSQRAVTVSINVEPDDYEKLRQAADRRRVPLAYIVREILHREVEHWPVAEREAVPA